jgi:hypothetical protein
VKEEHEKMVKKRYCEFLLGRNAMNALKTLKAVAVQPQAPVGHSFRFFNCLKRYAAPQGTQWRSD